MGCTSGRYACCLLVVLVTFIGILSMYHLNPILKSLHLSTVGITDLNPRKDTNNADWKKKFLSFDDGRKMIMELAKLKSKLKAMKLKPKPKGPHYGDPVIEGDKDVKQSDHVIAGDKDVKQSDHVIAGDKDLKQSDHVIAGDKDVKQSDHVIAGDKDVKQSDHVIAGDKDVKQSDHVIGGDKDVKQSDHVIGGDKDVKQSNVLHSVRTTKMFERPDEKHAQLDLPDKTDTKVPGPATDNLNRPLPTPSRVNQRAAAGQQTGNFHRTDKKRNENAHSVVHTQKLPELSNKKKHFYLDLLGRVVTDEPEAAVDEVNRPPRQPPRQVDHHTTNNLLKGKNLYQTDKEKEKEKQETDLLTTTKVSAQPVEKKQFYVDMWGKIITEEPEDVTDKPPHSPVKGAKPGPTSRTKSSRQKVDKSFHQTDDEKGGLHPVLTTTKVLEHSTTTKKHFYLDMNGKIITDEPEADSARNGRRKSRFQLLAKKARENAHHVLTTTKAPRQLLEKKHFHNDEMGRVVTDRPKAVAKVDTPMQPGNQVKQPEKTVLAKNNFQKEYEKELKEKSNGHPVITTTTTKLPAQPTKKKQFYVDMWGRIITEEPEAATAKPAHPPVQAEQPLPTNRTQGSRQKAYEKENLHSVLTTTKVSAPPTKKKQFYVDMWGKVITEEPGAVSDGERGSLHSSTQATPLELQDVKKEHSSQENVLTTSKNRHRVNRLKNVTPDMGSSVGQRKERPQYGDHTSRTGINLMVHLTWRSNNLPEIAKNWVKQWPLTNAILKVAFWDDAAMDTLVRRHFEDFVPTWESYKFPIDRVRAFQILALYKFGGIYSDIDVVPLRPLELLINLYPCVLAQENPVVCKFFSKPRPENAPCVSMHLMACKANHPFLKVVIGSLKFAAFFRDCSAKPAHCTSADVLAKALMEYNRRDHSLENDVQLVQSDYFSPTFDSAEKKKVQIACTEAVLDNEQKRLCKILREEGFESKASASAYALHKFLHTWGSRSNLNQGVIRDGDDSVYDLITDNVIDAKTLI